MDLYGVRYVICTKETGAKLLSDYQLLRSKDGMQLYEIKMYFHLDILMMDICHHKHIKL